MGSPLGLAGIFFDLLARTHLQHSWSLIAVANRFLTLLQKNSLHNTFCKGSICKHSFLVAFAVARPVFDALQKNSFAHHFLQEDRLGPEEIVPLLLSSCSPLLLFPLLSSVAHSCSLFLSSCSFLALLCCSLLSLPCSPLLLSLCSPLSLCCSPLLSSRA